MCGGRGGGGFMRGGPRVKLCLIAVNGFPEWVMARLSWRKFETYCLVSAENVLLFLTTIFFAVNEAKTLF